MWQDWVMAIANLTFVVSLWPTVRDRVALPRMTAVPTTIALYAIAACAVTLGLYWSAAMTGASAVMWTIIARRSR